MSVQKMKYCVGGEWLESKTDKWMDVTDSSTGEVIAQVPCCTAEEVEAAIAAADAAFPEWSQQSISKRTQMMFKWRDVLVAHLDELTVQIDYDEEGKQHMLMNGMDVTDDIRSLEIGQKASIVSTHALVRDMLLDMQRDVAKKHNVIMDGRDIGTVVLPKATVKIFLTASAEVRAQRRVDELRAKGQKADLQKVLSEIEQRDYRDSHRAVAPLKQAKDAVLVDTSELDIEGVVSAIREIISKKVKL